MIQKTRSLGSIKDLLQELKRRLADLYSDRLEAIILYGSFARDQATEDSDIDIAVLLRGAVNVSKEMDRLSEFASDLGLEYDELISILPFSSSEVSDSVWPLYRNLRREGVAL